MEVGTAVKRLSEFLPPDARARILKLTLEHYDINDMARDIGCHPSLIRKWSNGDKPSDENMAKVLAIALLRCEETKDVINSFLNEVKRLCEKLNVSEKPGKMDLLMGSIDENSRQIVRYLLRNRHAGIRKLADLIHASSDMEMLTRIKEVINPKALEIMGEPLMKFEHSKIDPLTGKKYVFNWWLTEGLTENEDDEGLLDVFDEKDSLRVIAYLPPQNGDVYVEVRGDFLVISAKEYYKEVPLFYSVEKKFEKTYRNGVLEIRLNKLDELTCQSKSTKTT